MKRIGEATEATKIKLLTMNLFSLSQSVKYYFEKK